MVPLSSGASEALQTLCGMSEHALTDEVRHTELDDAQRARQQQILSACTSFIRAVLEHKGVSAAELHTFARSVASLIERNIHDAAVAGLNVCVHNHTCYMRYTMLIFVRWQTAQPSFKVAGGNARGDVAAHARGVRVGTHEPPRRGMQCSSSCCAHRPRAN